MLIRSQRSAFKPRIGSTIDEVKKFSAKRVKILSCGKVIPDKTWTEVKEDLLSSTRVHKHNLSERQQTPFNREFPGDLTEV